MIKRLATASLALPLALAWGCRTAPKASRVIANAGGQKITETDFSNLVKALAPDPAQATSFLSDPAKRESRAQLADQMAMQKAIVAYAQREGVAQDPKVQVQLEGAEAQIYLQALVQKRLEGVVPTEEQLKAWYDQRVADLKAQGQAGSAPSYEMVRPQLPNLWRQNRSRELAQEVQKDIRAQIPITLADEYKPAGQL